MAFACPNCGRPHPSAGASGRAVRCACGQTLVNGAPVAASSSAPTLPPPLPGRPAPPATGYDPAAARHGLLIEERQAQALAAPSPFLVPEVDDADVQPLDDAPPSAGRPGAAAGREAPRRAGPRRRASPGWRWVRRAAVALLLLAAAAGAAWQLYPRYAAFLPPAAGQAVHRLLGARGPGPAEVAAALEASAMPFRACVQAAERGRHRLEVSGRRVTLRLTVTSSGRVSASRLDEADVEGTTLGACLRSTARRMAFRPFPGAPVDLRIPLDLGGRG